MRVLLMGNPNVGKSVVFNRLTGVSVITANYPGTTVEFSRGSMKLGEELAEVVDVPGTYTLDPTCQAETVAVDMLRAHFDLEMGGEREARALQGPALVIAVVDSTNLERSLNLTLQLLKRRVPMVVCLNMWDETRHTGVIIDVPELQRLLGVPCVPTCALTGVGIKDLVESLPAAAVGTLEYSRGDRWTEVGRVVSAVQRIEHRHHSLLERLGDASVRPLTALPLALLVGGLGFLAVRMIGEGLIENVLDPLFERFWAPVVLALSRLLGGAGFLHRILVGELPDGVLDLEQALGLVSTGPYISLGVVLPYVFAFYLVLSILEDTGYLPRLAVLMDNLMHRLGMHGMAIVPLILGLGCNVPAILASRILETRRERFISAVIAAITVPCMAQTAMIASLVGKVEGPPLRGAAVFLAIFATLVAVAAALGLIFNRTLKGESTELLMDIPPYRLPYLPGLLAKLWMRLRWYALEAVPWVLLGLLLINLLEYSGATALAGLAAAPVVEHVFGLPREAVGGLVAGFLRKDVAVGMLLPLHLDWRQVAVASVVLTMYFPCVATFTVMLKEFGPRDMAKAAAIMLAVTLIAGGVLNLVLGLFG